MRLDTITAAATTRFAYDGLDLIAETDGAGAITRRFVHGPGVDEPLVEYDGATTATRRWLHADERGSIVAQSDASGNVTQINRYDEYGNRSSPTPAGSSTPARPGCPRSALIITRRGSMPPRSAGSCKATRLGIRGV